MTTPISRRDCLLLGLGGLAALRVQEDPGLVVHEWGVVTVPYGAPEGGARSAGIRKGKDGREISDLPDFVKTWTFKVGEQIEQLERMPVRKPVLHFYATKATRVRVRVDIPSGRPDAWWPPASDFGPKSGFDVSPRLGGRPRKVEEIERKNGYLEWSSLRVDPAAKVPGPSGGWWDLARNVDATPVAVDSGSEKFLFYDALVRFDPGLSILWKKEGKVAIRNTSGEPCRDLFALRVREGRCSTAYVADLGAGKEIEAAVVDGDPKTLADVMVAAGLYRKEAEAVVEIWREELLRMDGARVVYRVSREAYDRLLPLEINPAPRELRRVLLAHVECPSAELREEVEGLVERLGAEDPQSRDEAAAGIRARMPLAASLIREALAAAKDAEVRGRLADLLKAPSRP